MPSFLVLRTHLWGIPAFLLVESEARVMDVSLMPLLAADFRFLPNTIKDFFSSLFGTNLNVFPFAPPQPKNLHGLGRPLSPPEGEFKHDSFLLRFVLLRVVAFFANFL